MTALGQPRGKSVTKRVAQGVVRGLTLTLVACALVAGTALPGESRAQSASADWELTELTGPIIDLATPPTGAIFAIQRDDDDPAQSSAGTYWRSNDDGDTWNEIGVPLATAYLYPDPSDPATLFTTGWRLRKSVDGGQTWTRLVSNGLPDVRDLGHPRSVAISPVDHQLIYLEEGSGSVSWTLRSHDGGQTWEKTGELWGPSPSCVITIPVVRAHPTDPARLLRVAGCSFLLGDVGPVSVSKDQGSTWSIRGKPVLDSYYTGITDLVGWEGVLPDRLYVTTIHTEPSGPGKSVRLIGRSIYRSDDEGRGWKLLYSTAHSGEAETVPSVTGLAYDPARPDIVFFSTVSGVRVSTDAGESWGDLGRQDLPRIRRIALGADGRTLYAATDGGLFRLHLAD